MYYFDSVEEKNINGFSEVFAVNKENNQAYLLRNVIISPIESTSTGFSLRISCYPESYTYRGGFNTKDEADKFVNDVMSLINKANRTNYGL